MELAIVLGATGMIIGAVWISASRVNEVARANDAMNELQVIQRNITDLMTGRTLPGTYPNIQAPALLADGVIPKAYTPPSAMQTPWGVSAAAVTPWGSYLQVFYDAPRSFRVSFYNVPESSCVTMLTRIAACQPNEIGCPIAVSTANNTVTVTLDPVAGWSAALNALPVVQLCSNNDSTKNSVEFEYQL